MATPTLIGLREIYPNAQITLLLGPTDPGPWLRDRCLFDNYIVDKGTRVYHHPLHSLSLLGKIKRGKFDIVVSLWSNSRSAWLFKMAGIPVRVGSTDRHYKKLYTHHLDRDLDNPTQHEIEYHYDLIRPLGGKGAPGRMQYAFSRDDILQADRLLQAAEIVPDERFVLINPTFGGSSRMLPAERFVQIANLLSTRTKIRIVLTGTQSDIPHNAKIREQLPLDAVDLTGKTSIEVLAALLCRCALHISIDTGTMHLASAMQTPSVAIYPVMAHWNDRVRWSPWKTEYRLVGPRSYCPGCSPEHCTRMNDICGRSVETEEVVSAALSLLETAPVAVAAR